MSIVINTDFRSPISVSGWLSWRVSAGCHL